MSQKIKNITIKSFRGVVDELPILLSEKSALFYGDNGTGKSSIVDALEWFYKDSVSHLSSAEIDKSALRNINLKEDENASVSLDFTKTSLKSDKTLSVVRGKIISANSNKSDELRDYIKQSEKENLLLRYRSLEDFINAPKGDKLKQLYEIIGYAEVTKIKEIIQKSFNSIKNEIKSQGFQNQLQFQQSLLIQRLGANITSESQLFGELNTLIIPLNIGIKIASFDDIDKVIEKIKSPIGDKNVIELKFLQDCDAAVTNLEKDIPQIDLEYKKYFEEFEKIFNDVESVKETLLKELLIEGESILSNQFYTQEKCPLCLKDENQEILALSIRNRLSEIEKSSAKLKELNKAKDLIKLTIEKRINIIEGLLKNDLSKKYVSVESALSSLKNKLSNYLLEINSRVLSGKMIKTEIELKLNISDFLCVPVIAGQLKTLNDKIAKDNYSEARVKIEFSKAAFLKIQDLSRQESLLESQKDSIGLIYNEFIKKQREGLEEFLNSFSKTINEYYQFMNPGESFEDLEIVQIEEGDELRGITIQFKFNGEMVSPPQKYFSESHINCYGLAFFLASVEAFNSINKFIILDDVISSFDSNHRKRFADLLFEKFSDYQIVLLSHEKEWFMYVRELAKRNGWLIKEIKWTKERGTYFDESPSELKELIEYQIKNNKEEQLGNSIRTYLEHILKDICYHLEVKTKFLFNGQNEKRMADELLSELRSAINKKSVDLKIKIPIIERISNSTILGNLLSHDNPINPKIGDLKAFWADVESFVNIFYCNEEGCGKPVSMNYYDGVNKCIRCSCGKISYKWDK